MNEPSDRGNYLRIEIFIPYRGLDRFKEHVNDAYDVDEDVAAKFQFDSDRWVFEEEV